MKRLAIFVYTFLISLTAFSQNDKFSRWSVAPEFGYNYFDGDINQNLTSLFPSSSRALTYGASVEYAMTPVWGLAVDYYHFPLSAKTLTQYPLFINTDLNTFRLNATINFTRWIFPQSKSKITINGSIGAGFATYKYDVRMVNPIDGSMGDTVSRTLKTANGTPVLLYEDNKPLRQGFAISVPVAFSVEYNLSNSIGIGAKMQYTAFNKDNVEGVYYLNYKGVTNDFVGAGTVFVRYKLNANKKPHLRNIPMDVYQPEEGLILAKELSKKFDRLSAKVDAVDKKVDNLIPRIDKLENMLTTDGPDADGDGVPDVRDKEPKTPPNTPVDFWGKTLPISSNNIKNYDSKTVPQPAVTNVKNYNNITTTKKQALNYSDDIPSVYFDFDQILLREDALITISKIAKRMLEDPNLYVEVRGYCDYIGNSPYNKTLSKRRAERVKSELVKIWKVPADHIIANGNGKIIEPRIKYLPNRRCDFFFNNQ